MAATPSPVTPDDFKALIPSNTAGACEAFAKALIGIPTRIWELISWLLTADGFISRRALADNQPGDLIMSMASVAAGNRLLCNGNPYNVSEYPDLFAVIQYTYGGAGATFNVPNFKDRFPVSVGDSVLLGAQGGFARKQLAKGDLPLLDGTVTPSGGLQFATQLIGSSTQEAGDEGNPSYSFNQEAPTFVASVEFTIEGTGPDELGREVDFRPPFMGVYIYIQT